MEAANLIGCDLGLKDLQLSIQLRLSTLILGVMQGSRSSSSEFPSLSCTLLTVCSFTKPDVLRIVPFCHLDTLQFRNRYRATPLEALCLVLIRLAYPVRILSLVEQKASELGGLEG